jgi:hypothetical protein
MIERVIAYNTQIDSPFGRAGLASNARNIELGDRAICRGFRAKKRRAAPTESRAETQLWSERLRGPSCIYIQYKAFQPGQWLNCGDLT